MLLTIISQNLQLKSIIKQEKTQNNKFLTFWTELCPFIHLIGYGNCLLNNSESVEAMVAQ